MNEKLCPIMSTPTSRDNIRHAFFFGVALRRSQKKDAPYMPVLNDFIPCQFEQCYKYASCSKEEYDALVEWGLSQEAFELKELTKTRIKGINDEH